MSRWPLLVLGATVLLGGLFTVLVLKTPLFHPLKVRLLGRTFPWVATGWKSGVAKASR